MLLLTLRSDGGNLESTDSTLIEKHVQRERECAVAIAWFHTVEAGHWALQFVDGDLYEKLALELWQFFVYE